MAKEQAYAFVEKMLNDQDFNKQVSDYVKSHDKEESREYLQELGYAVEEAEVREAISELAGEELSEDDLDRVAGGAGEGWQALAGIVGIAGAAAVAAIAAA